MVCVQLPVKFEVPRHEVFFDLFNKQFIWPNPKEKNTSFKDGFCADRNYGPFHYIY